MIAIDTNILVYASDADAAGHAECLSLLQDLQAGTTAASLPWNVMYEFFRVVTHPKVMRRPWTLAHAQDFTATLLQSPTVEMLAPSARHHAVLSEAVKELPRVAGNLVFDFHTAVLMREHGIRRIVTNDMDFHRFPWVEVHNPLA